MSSLCLVLVLLVQAGIERIFPRLAQPTACISRVTDPLHYPVRRLLATCSYCYCRTGLPEPEASTGLTEQVTNREHQSHLWVTLENLNSGSKFTIKPQMALTLSFYLHSSHIGHQSS